jgi:hypothetical protein
MHKACKRLYELEFRDGLKWWVEAWFIFLKWIHNVWSIVKKKLSVHIINFLY